MNRAITAAAGAAASTIALGAVSWIGTARWRRETTDCVRRLNASQMGMNDDTVASRLSDVALAALPQPVARYFAFALTPNQRLVRRARFAQVGELRANSGDAWKPFTAVEEFATRPLGFVWDASMRSAPLITIKIRDRYLDGEGCSEAKIAATVSLGRHAGTAEVNSASLVRFLAEAPWLPTALLPSDYLTWTAIDTARALATLRDRGTTVSAEFTFNGEGAISRVATERYRDVGGVSVLTPWAGTFTEYAHVDGMVIPLTAEVRWAPPEGSVSVWRGRIADARYVFAT